MTSLERKLIVYFLNLAADEFSNHGCNDFRAKDADLTKQEIKSLQELLKTEGFYGDDEVPDSDIFYDWMIMNLMAERLEKNITLKNGPKEYVVDKDLVCSQCNNVMEPKEGCLVCRNCGFNRG
jgi:hypothetical protein